MPVKVLGKSAIQVGLLLIVALLSTSLGAQGLESADRRLVSERPNSSGEPTLVTFGIYIFDIDEIDDVNQRFSVDMFTIVTWHDPRMALPEDERSGRIRSFPLDEIWAPLGLIVNDRGLSRQLPRIATIDDLGKVVYRQRLSGDLAVALELKEFPFDKQRLLIDFVSYQYSPDEIRFSVDADIRGNPGSFSAAGWKMKILEPDYGEFTVPAAGLVRPRLTYYIEAQRNAQYYLLTMFLPMSLIVFMSWTVFWLQPDIVPARIGISTASIFSLLALGFSIRLSLPAVSYMTRADLFVIGCTLLVFVALGVAVIGSRWASSDRMEQALRLNAVARWFYVGLFGLVITIALTL
jgi:gamma-aminobutyric acid receptor subunit beta